MDFILPGITKAFHLLFSGDEETYAAVGATLHAVSFSMAASLCIGIPLGYGLGFFSFTGKKALRLVVDTLLALPTVFIGLLLYALLSNRGPLGEMNLLFTLKGIAIGQTILALPIVSALTAASVEALDRSLRPTLMSLGASRRQ
ncbi:MAG: ABC transporter permease, partial [Deltaproteobacteria bacterium]